MQKELLIACHECDLLHRIRNLPEGSTALCRRCNAVLYTHKKDSIDRSLALTMAGFMKNPIDLTHSIHEHMPVYPGTEQPRIITGCSIEKDGFLEKKLTFYSHTGTHMDAPAHMLKDGKCLEKNCSD